MMKRSTYSIIFAVAFLAILLSNNAFAQDGYSVNDQIAKLKTELNLSKDQSRKVALLLIKNDEKQTEDNERLAGDPDALRKAARKRRDTLNKKMEKILDSGQFEKFQKMSFRSPSERTARQIKNLTEALTLTDEQVEHVQAVYEKYQPEMEQIFQTFRGEGGGGDVDRQAMRTKMGELRKKMFDEINTILTDEQKEKYTKYLEQNRSRGQGRGDRSGGRSGQ